MTTYLHNLTDTTPTAAAQAHGRYGLPQRVAQSWGVEVLPLCTPSFAVPPRLRRRHGVAVGRLELAERPAGCLGTEIAGVKHLNAGLMISLEGRLRARASGGRGIGSVAEPKAQMVGMHRCRRGIRQCVEGIGLRGGA